MEAVLGLIAVFGRAQSPDFDARNFGFPRLSDLVDASGIVEIERIGDNPKIIMVRLKGEATARPAK
ncbi:MAG: hypothetical protein B7Z15_20315 [Rhizobiales bacterium 32-66-8]|nr:MAG: hypothetical protein B7Z15_20315 [Rhizobiales bacterium 32-66-8]